MNDIRTIPASDLRVGQKFYLYGAECPWSVVEVTDLSPEPDFGPGYLGVGVKRAWIRTRPHASTIMRPGETVDLLIAEVS